MARNNKGGRPRVPTALAELHGRPNRNWTPPVAEPLWAKPIGDPPDWFGPELAAEWRDITAHSPPGALHWGDRRLVEALAVASIELRETTLRLRAQPGRTYVTDRGDERTLPDFNNLCKIIALITRACGELGLSPTTRPKVNSDLYLGNPAPKKEDRVIARMKLRGVPADVDLETYLENRPLLPGEISKGGRNAA
jgi:hypothetical protein